MGSAKAKARAKKSYYNGSAAAPTKAKASSPDVVELLPGKADRSHRHVLENMTLLARGSCRELVTIYLE